MAEGRELILKLGQKITDRIGVKVTTSDPEYWGLACVITDEMAEVALAMKVRVPATAQWIAKRCKKSVERTEELLQEMSVIGLIEYNWENEDHHKQYVLPMFVPGCAEFMMMNAKQVEEHPELADFFEQMARLPLEKVTPMVPYGGAGIGMHVIPVEKAIPARQESADIEHISHWLNKYKNKYAVGACSCRRQQRVRGEEPAIWRMTCASASATWLIISWRQGKAAISIMRKSWKSCSGRRITAMSIRSPILTERKRFLPSATAPSVSATDCVPPSCLIPPICPAQPIVPV